MPCYVFTYRAHQDRRVVFNARMQQLAIDETLQAAGRLQFRPHFIATEGMHLHVLLSWTGEHAWHSLHASIRSAISQRLDREFRRRRWFAESCRRRRIRNSDQLQSTIDESLARHHGWKWREGLGYFTVLLHNGDWLPGANYGKRGTLIHTDLH